MEETRRTDPRILNLMVAVMTYIEAKDTPKNPFVKGFGSTQNSEQAYDYLVNSMSQLEDYSKEIEEFLQELILAENE